MTIPNEAIEAAEAEFASHRYISGHDGPAYCNGCDWSSRQIGIASTTQHATHRADAALSAAAPFIAAQAQAEAWDRCVNHIIASCTYVTSTAELWRHERLYSDLCTVRDSNPYRADHIEGNQS